MMEIAQSLIPSKKYAHSFVLLPYFSIPFLHQINCFTVTSVQADGLLGFRIINVDVRIFEMSVEDLNGEICFWNQRY